MISACTKKNLLYDVIVLSIALPVYHHGLLIENHRLKTVISVLLYTSKSSQNDIDN